MEQKVHDQHGGDRSLKLARVLGLLGLLATPFSAFAFSGMTIPTGTVTLVDNAITTYFFPTILTTLFQNQVIQIVVLFAAIWVMWRLILVVWRKIHHPGH